MVCEAVFVGAIGTVSDAFPVLTFHVSELAPEMIYPNAVGLCNVIVPILAVGATSCVIVRAAVSAEEPIITTSSWAFGTLFGVQLVLRFQLPPESTTLQVSVAPNRRLKGIIDVSNMDVFISRI